MRVAVPSGVPTTCFEKLAYFAHVSSGVLTDRERAGIHYPKTPDWAESDG
jgi:hypothetical protein